LQSSDIFTTLGKISTVSAPSGVGSRFLRMRFALSLPSGSEVPALEYFLFFVFACEGSGVEDVADAPGVPVGSSMVGTTDWEPRLEDDAELTVETDFFRPGFTAVVTDDFRRLAGRISVGAVFSWGSVWAWSDERGGWVFARFSAARAASTLAYSSKASSGSSRGDSG
jgi:hypothetical protein